MQYFFLPPEWYNYPDSEGLSIQSEISAPADRGPGTEPISNISMWTIRRMKAY